MTPLEAPMVGVWRFDPAHTRIGFSARHAMVTTVRGTFKEVEGVINVEGDDIASTRVEVIIQAASVDTYNDERDKHLRSVDFFDVGRYPQIRFLSSAIEEVEGDNYVVVGDLTIKAVTKEVTIPIELLGIQRDPVGNLRAGFEGTRRLNRRDYGLHWNMPLDQGGVLVSEKVTLEFEISAIRTEQGDDGGPHPA